MNFNNLNKKMKKKVCNLQTPYYFFNVVEHHCFLLKEDLHNPNGTMVEMNGSGYGVSVRLAILLVICEYTYDI